MTDSWPGKDPQTRAYAPPTPSHTQAYSQTAGEDSVGVRRNDRHGVDAGPGR